MSRRPHVGDLPRIATGHWLVLTLAIEKPSYGYEIAERYDRRFGTFLPVGRTAIYSALDRLHRVGLVEPQQQAGGGKGFRRIWILYAPTSEAIDAHERWLSSLITSERWHPEMLARVGSAHLHGATAIQEMLDRYAYYAELHRQRIQERVTERSVASRASVQAASAMLLLEEQQSVTAAQIEWVNDVRQQTITGWGNRP